MIKFTEMNALERTIINRKQLIKQLNVIRAEREAQRQKIESASTDEEKARMREYLSVLNARISEKWAFYNSVVKTQKMLEDAGLVSRL